MVGKIKGKRFYRIFRATIPRINVLMAIGVVAVLVNPVFGGYTGTTSLKNIQTIKKQNIDIGTTLEFEYDFQPPHLDTDDLGTSIVIPGLCTVGKPGAPELPVKTTKILLPQGMKVEHIEARPDKEIAIPGTYMITHAQKPMPLSYTGDMQLTPSDLEIYESLEPYPDTYCIFITTQTSRGYTIIVVNLFPIHYIPKTGILSYAQKMILTVYLQPEEIIQTGVLQPRNLPQDRIWITEMIDNPEALATYTMETQKSEKLGGKNGFVNPTDTYTYVVITNQALRDATGEYTFQDLIALKIAKGISATIVTVEDIYANYPGRDHQEQIRNFIRDAYENWETEYILLGGDGDGADVGGESGDSIVPTRELFAYIYPDSQEAGDFIAADLYYACLDGSYDSNNNNIFGEIGDGYDISSDGEVDLSAEVYVGRAPVDNATELSNFVRKTLAYENTDDPYLENVRMVGELLFDVILGVELKVFAKQAKDEIKDGTPSTAGIPREKYNVSTLYDDEGMMKQETIDLSSYAGTSDHVRIGFRLQSDNYLNYAGFYVDDVNVTGDDGTSLFSDDMEHGENGWTHGGAGDEWELGIPLMGALQTHSGINCWGTNLNGYYENLCDQRLVSPSIDLSSVTTANLSFYHWSYTEEDHDYCYVELSIDGGQSWHTLQTYTGGWTKNDLTQIINDGVHVINHLGHCNNFHLMRLDEPVSMRNMVISGPSHDIQNLTNDHPFFVYSQGCYPGAFDNREPGPPLFENPGYYPYDCIGEYLLGNEHGAFACVLSSRYGLGAVDPRQGPSQYFDKEFFDVLYGENKRNLGIANQDSKEENIGLLDQIGMRYCYYEVNLLGDPEVAIKDPEPRDHDIAVAKLNATEYMKVNRSNSITATIHNAGRNLETDICVQLCMNRQPIDQKMIASLASGQSCDVMFNWVPSIEGTYLLDITVPPLPGETMLYNNQMTRIIHVCSGDAVYVCVLDSFATGFGHGICDTLNQDWETYGSVPVVIDYKTFGGGRVTYARLVAAHPDVLLVSMMYPMLGGHEFSHGEITAITTYVEEGHGFIAINNPFYCRAEGFGTIDNRELLPLFGLRDDLDLYTLGGNARNLALLVPDHPLFRNVPNPYSVGSPSCSVPHGYGSWWSAADLSGGAFVAQSSNSQGVIVVNDSCVYISNCIDMEQNTNDLQFLYNAILWANNPTGLLAFANGPYSGVVGVPVLFHGSAVGGCPSYSWQWDFGDGNTSSLQNPSYAYTSEGNYIVTLTVTDGQSNTSNDTASVHIQPALIADAHGPYTGETGKPIQFTGTATGGIPPYTYHWDFGDGNTSELQNPEHIYKIADTYTVTITVTDSSHTSDSDTTTATITKEDDTTPPTIEIRKPENALYLNNKKILPFSIPVIIKKIDIDVNASDDQIGIDKVEFYIDNKLTATDTSPPYSWTWDKRAFFRHTIRVTAYDIAGNNASKEITVLKFF
jgi:PKD repeat protein